MPYIERLTRGRVHYAWVVAAVTFFVMLAAAGARSTPGVLIVPFEKEFGWSRETISIAISINILLYGLMGPFSAALVERLGLRSLMMLALSMLAIGIAATSLMTQPWHLMLLWGVVVGVGSGSAALALSAMVVNRWFIERRGLMMGLLTASSATGQLVFLPALAALVEHFGWRAAAIGIAAVATIVVPVVGLLMRDRPQDIGLNPYGAKEDFKAPPASGVNPLVLAVTTLGEAMKTRDFWLLFASFFVCGASTNGLIGTHLISACFDAGIPEVQAAGLLAVMGIFDFIGTTGSGWLSDRVNSRYLLFWYYALRGLSLMYLPFALESSFYGLSLFAVFYGLDWIATVPPTVRLTTDIFGREKAGIVFGWIAAGHQIGAAMATYGAGAIRSNLGAYLLAFIGAGILCLIASVIVLGIGVRRKTTGPAVAAA